MKYFASAALGILLLAIQQSNAQNLVQNPGFETGDLTGWTSSGSVSAIGYASHTGNDSALLAISSGDLSQTITTVPGDTYDYTFWVSYALGSGPPDSFSASWNGSQVFSINTSSGGTTSFAEETYNETATSTSSTIDFGAAVNDGNGFFVDDVSVVNITPATAPDGGSTVALLGLALAGLGGIKNRLLRRS